MDVQLLVVKIAQKLRQDGPRATFSKAFAYLTRSRTADDFDVKHDTDTGGFEPLWKFQISSPNRRFGFGYQATDEPQLADAIDYLHEDPQNLTFIDIGCGKGRALLGAANGGFKQIIGVEFAHELAEIARKNLAKMRIANAIVVQTDAAEYHFLNSDMVVYLYNPFLQEVMQKVVANLRESLSGKLYVIYKAPKCATILDTCGFLTRLGSPPARAYIQIWRATVSRKSDQRVSTAKL